MEFRKIPIPASKVLESATFALAEVKLLIKLLLMIGLPLLVIPRIDAVVALLVFCDTFLIIFGKAAVPIIPVPV
jgi:hypothetical protein